MLGLAYLNDSLATLAELGVARHKVHEMFMVGVNREVLIDGQLQLACNEYMINVIKKDIGL